MTALTTKLNLAHTVFDSAQKTPEAPALILTDSNTTVSFKELARQVESLAGFLESEGLQPGERVGLLVYNQPAYVIAFFALLSLGITVIPLNVRLTAPEISTILNDAEARYLISTQDFTGVLTRLSVPTLTGLIIQGLSKVKNSFKNTAPHLDDFDAIIASDHKTKAPLPYPIQPKTLATLVYTSGTTGEPKGVMLSHGNIWADARANIQVIEAQNTDRFITISPLFHVFGQTNVLITALSVGASVVLVKKFSPRKVLEAIQHHDVTFMAAVPTMYHMMLTHLRDHHYNLSSLRVCHSGAAAMPLDLIQRIESTFGAPVQEGYGLSEASSIVCSNPLPSRGVQKPGSVGPAIPGVQVRAVDDTLKEVATGDVGELLVKGPIVMQGYYKRPTLSQTALIEIDNTLWLRTKDLARLDADGYVYIVDRTDDLINIGGVKVYPREIEEVLFSHPAIQAAVVIGEPSNLYHQEIKAFIVLEADLEKEILPDEIYRYCKNVLAEYKIPKTFEFVDEIPKGPTGKTLRKAFRQSD